MSAAPANPITLTVEYAGICALLLSKSGPSRVWLLDLAAMGRSKHFPALTVETRQYGSGSTPDAVMSRPNDDLEYAVWKLEGCTVEFDTGALPTGVKYARGGVKVDQDPTGQDLMDLAWLFDLDTVCGSDELIDQPGELIAAEVALSGGRVEAVWTPTMFKYTYELRDGSRLAVPMRYCTWRVRHVVDFGGAPSVRMTSRDGHKRQVALSPGASVLISNLCECPSSGAGDHFYGYYELLKPPHRRPTIEHKQTGGVDPYVDPEHCGMLYVEIP
jgi:hypothetical protein